LLYLGEFLWNSLNEISSLSAFQNYGKKIRFQGILKPTTDGRRFCSKTSNFAQNFTPQNNFEELNC